MQPQRDYNWNHEMAIVITLFPMNYNRTLTNSSIAHTHTLVFLYDAAKETETYSVARRQVKSIYCVSSYGLQTLRLLVGVF